MTDGCQLNTAQRRWEGTATNLVFTGLFFGGSLYLYSEGVPFNVLALFFLSVIAANTGGTWRVVCR